MDRRKFFRSVMQGGIFSALTVASGYLLLRERPENTAGCDLEFICQDCKKNSFCKLPEASTYRKDKFLNR